MSKGSQKMEKAFKDDNGGLEKLHRIDGPAISFVQVGRTDSYMCVAWFMNT